MNDGMKLPDAPVPASRLPEAECCCGRGRIYERNVHTELTEWAHFVGDAFDRGDLTRCADGGYAEPKPGTITTTRRTVLL